MAETKWLISPLKKNHDRSEFDCSNDKLNSYLKTLATQYQKKDFARTFVATKSRSKEVKGYYSMNGGNVDLSLLPEKERKRLPRHPVPVVHIARLAVCQSAQGQGLGETLLMDALNRTFAIAESDLGIHAVEVVAIDGKAVSFYSRFGLQSLLDDNQHMYLSMKIIRNLLNP